MSLSSDLLNSVKGPYVDGLANEVARQRGKGNTAGKTHHRVEGRLIVIEAAGGPVHTELRGKQYQGVAKGGAEYRALGGLATV